MQYTHIGENERFKKKTLNESWVVTWRMTDSEWCDVMWRLCLRLFIVTGSATLDDLWPQTVCLSENRELLSGHRLRYFWGHTCLTRRWYLLNYCVRIFSTSSCVSWTSRGIPRDWALGCCVCVTGMLYCELGNVTYNALYLVDLP